jgi:hypothetical protein
MEVGICRRVVFLENSYWFIGLGKFKSTDDSW